MAETHSSSIEIESTPEELFEIITDLDQYPDWVQGVKSVDVHSTTDDGFPERATMVVDAAIKTVQYTLVYDYDYPGLVSWVAEPGSDLKQLDGSYRFEPNDDGTTTVLYDLTIDPNFRVPGFMVRQAQKAIMAAALGGLKQRAEA